MIKSFNRVAIRCKSSHVTDLEYLIHSIESIVHSHIHHMTAHIRNLINEEHISSKTAFPFVNQIFSQSYEPYKGEPTHAYIGYHTLLG